MTDQTMTTADTPRRRGALLIAALGAALALSGTASAQATSTSAQPRSGAQIFSSTCAACHQAQGEGTPTYPPCPRVSIFQPSRPAGLPSSVRSGCR